MKKIRIALCVLIFFSILICVNFYNSILIKQVSELTQKNEQIICKLQDTTAALNFTSENLLKTEEELKVVKSQFSEASDELINTKEELNNTEEELANTKKSLKDTEEKLNSTKKELAKAKKTIEDLSKKKTSTKSSTSTKTSNYTVATQVWKELKSYGWSDVACAGIMGNLMAETGGGTLKLNWKSNSSSGLGLVQWIGGRRNAIVKKYGTTPTIKQQIKFMHDELYGTNGVRRQVSKDQLNAILKAKTPEDAAYAFASYYERCATQYRNIRKSYARKAYNYFVN